MTQKDAHPTLSFSADKERNLIVPSSAFVSGSRLNKHEMKYETGKSGPHSGDDSFQAMCEHDSQTEFNLRNGMNHGGLTTSCSLTVFIVSLGLK